MADYQPLVARAVAGLDKNTGENRRALYERARTALVNQLRGVEPALDESDITRERLALEEAIRKVEAEAVKRTRPRSSRAGRIAVRSGPARLPRDGGRRRGPGRRGGRGQPFGARSLQAMPGEQPPRLAMAARMRPRITSIRSPRPSAIHRTNLHQRTIIRRLAQAPTLAAAAIALRGR